METVGSWPRAVPCSDPIRHRGTTLDRRRGGRIQRIIRTNPTISRVALAERVCYPPGQRSFKKRLSLGPECLWPPPLVLPLILTGTGHSPAQAGDSNASATSRQASTWARERWWVSLPP